MKEIIKKYNLIAAFLMLCFIPMLLLVLGDFPQRKMLKQAISIVTLSAFFLMLGQFYLSRFNRLIQVHKKSGVIKIHKLIGYTFATVLLTHPFLIVAPRFFESGVEPMEAFTTLITTFDSTGVVLGMIAWGLMIALGLSSLFRNRIGMKYRAWRFFHGILSALFICLASWHAIDLGRHTDTALSAYIIVLAGGAVLLLLNTYIFKPKNLLSKEAN